MSRTSRQVFMFDFANKVVVIVSNERIHMRKYVALVLALFLSLSGIPATSAFSLNCVSGGSGTISEPTIICDANDFEALKTATSGYFKLGGDIDLSEVAWNESSNFNGQLDGSGHTVSGLAIIANSATGVNGLFNQLGRESVIKNIRFKDANLQVVSRSYAGILALSISGQVENVLVQGVIRTNTTYTGGFAGILSGGQVSNSVSDIEIFQNGGSYTGGFFGIVEGNEAVSLGTINNSLFTGSITGSGWHAPISLNGSPFWSPEDSEDPPFPTCDYALETYYVSTSAEDPIDCGISKTADELSAATQTTEGFGGFSADKWTFGGGIVLLQLSSFAQVPPRGIFTEPQDYYESSIGSETQIVTVLDSNQSSVIWVENHEIYSGLLGIDGVVSNPSRIFEAFGDIQLDKKQSVTLLPDGSLAVIWSETLAIDVDTNPYLQSSVFVSYSPDGKNWSPPIQAFDQLEATSPRCFEDDIIPICGYYNSIIESDGLGRIAVSTKKVLPLQELLLVKTSLDGVYFSQASELSRNLGVKSSSIRGLSSGGFTAVWTERGGFPYHLLSSHNAMGTRSTWSPIKVVDDLSNQDPEFSFEQSNANTMTILYDQSPSNSVDVVRKDFSTTSNSWSQAEPVASLQNGIIKNGAIKLSYQGNRFAAAFTIGVLEYQRSHQYIFEKVSGVPQAVQKVSTKGDQFLSVNALQITGDGSVMAVWSGQNSKPFIGLYKSPANPVETLLPTNLDKSEIYGAFSTSGNGYFFAVTQSSDPSKYTIYKGAEVPTAAGPASYSGTQRVGSKLTARTVLFESLSGIGKTTRQWYSCSRAVPANTTVKPSTCSAISKATGSTFKPTSKQRGRFVTVAVKNTNSVGTTTVFAPVSSKVR